MRSSLFDNAVMTTRTMMIITSGDYFSVRMNDGFLFCVIEFITD